MPPNNKHIGRRVSVGFGIETTPGTAVAPAIWSRHMKLDFQPKTTTIDNNSAMGRNEGVNDSAVVEQWAEGTLESKVYDLSIGYLLRNILPTLTTTANADASGLVKNHQFDVGSTNAAPGLTIVRKDPVTNRRHAMGALRQLEIIGVNNDWLKVTADLVAKAGVAGTDTPAYVTERSFVGRHLAVKLANNVAGLAGATAIDLKSFKLTLSRPVALYFPIGSNEPSEMDAEVFTATGELVLRYKNTDYEDLWFANTIQALSFVATNTDVTIGTAAKPSLGFTGPKVRLNTFAKSDDLDKVVEQTVGIKFELDETAGYMIRALLTNLQAAY